MNKEILENIKNPDRNYGIYKIIHDKISGSEKSPKRLDAKGFAGVVCNVRYDRDFPNNKDAWKSFYDGVSGYHECGMKTWIYDESGYPSGTARGHIFKEHPEYVAKGLNCFFYWKTICGGAYFRADIPDGELYKAFLFPIQKEMDPLDITESLNKDAILEIDVPEGEFYLFIMTVKRLFDGTHCTSGYSEPRNYISLTDKNAVRDFIKCTHENYKTALGGNFGENMISFFTDEPSLIAMGAKDITFPVLPWHNTYPETFKRKYGYDFHLAACAVATGRGESLIKRRCDFWEFIADGVADGYFGELRRWCHKNGTLSSGHLFGEEKLSVHIAGYGSFYRSMKQFDIPGMDKITTVPKMLMKDTDIPMGIIASSIAEIYGCGESFTEFSDIIEADNGEVSPYKYYIASVNWHLAQGINNFTSYYSFRGLSDEDIISLNRYTARCGYLLRQGIHDCTVAVYYPEASMWSNFSITDKSLADDRSESFLSVEKNFVQTSWNLIHNCTEFNYIDDEVLEKGEIQGESFVYRNRCYRTLIFPSAGVLPDAVLHVAELAAKSGVQVIFVGEKPEFSRNSGERFDIKNIEALFSAKKFILCSPDKIASMISENITVCAKNEDGNIMKYSRLLPDGEKIVFLANMGDKNFEGCLKADKCFNKIQYMIPEDGELIDLSDENISIEAYKANIFIFSRSL